MSENLFRVIDGGLIFTESGELADYDITNANLQANEIVLGSKDVGGVTKLFTRDSGGNEFTLLDSNDDIGITGWGAGTANALVPDVAGTDIGAVGNEAGRIYGNNIIDLTAAGGAAQVLGPGGYAVRLYGGGVSLFSSLNIVSTLGIGGAFGNAKLTSSAADILDQRNGTNAQEYRLYNTYTDAGNNEYLSFRFVSNNAYIDTQKTGTGSGRNLFIGTNGTSQIGFYATNQIEFLTNFSPFTAGTLTVGTSVKPFKDIFLRPSSSLTPSSNGDVTIEFTDNNTITIKGKGSDGTVRSGTVALL